jgi:hypothetical protein
VELQQIPDRPERQSHRLLPEQGDAGRSDARRQDRTGTEGLNNPHSFMVILMHINDFVVVHQ